MATKLYPRTADATYGHGHNFAKADTTASAWVMRLLSTSAGALLQGLTVNTVAGPTNGLEIHTGGVPIDFISDPLAADVTISGTVTLNVWGFESNMSANAGPQVIIERIDSVGALSTIINSEAASEFGTSAGVKNWTGTPTSTAMKRGDRIRVRLLGNDVGTMATGFTFTIDYNGAVGGVDGDTWVQFNENLTFEPAPAGTVVYLTATASDVSTASVDKEAWTSRGSGSTDSITNTAAGWTSPIHATDTAGGTVIDWFTKRVTAFTLGGRADANIRGKVSAEADAIVRVEVAVVDSDGTNPVVWAAANPLGEFSTTDAAVTAVVAGPDTSVAAGQRLRIRLYIDDSHNSAMNAGDTVTMTYSGPTTLVAGDTFVTFAQTLTEFTAAAPVGRVIQTLKQSSQQSSF